MTFCADCTFEALLIWSLHGYGTVSNSIASIVDDFGIQSIDKIQDYLKLANDEFFLNKATYPKSSQSSQVRFSIFASETCQLDKRSRQDDRC